jgi:hypothetical protein
MGMTTFQARVKALLRARNEANSPEFKLLWNQKLLELYRQEYESGKQSKTSKV